MAITGVRKHAHDLRGTAITHMVEQGMNYTEVAIAVAWTEKDVERIAKRYVSRDRIISLVAARMALRPAPVEAKQDAVASAPSNHVVTTLAGNQEKD